MWIPQIGFGDPKNVEPVIRIDQIPPESWKHRCSICNELEGVCVQCSEPNCHSYYHITCAQLHSFMIEIKFSKKKDNIFLLSYCRKHSLVKRRQIIIFKAIFKLFISNRNIN